MSTSVRETAQAQRAYLDYQAQDPPRSLERLAERYQSAINPPTKRLKTLADWSRHHAWQERIRAYEARLKEEREAEEQERRRKMREARLGVAVEMMDKGHRKLRSVPAEQLSVRDAVAVLHESFDVQRRELGEPDQRVEVAGADGGPIEFTIVLDRGAGAG